MKSSELAVKVKEYLAWLKDAASKLVSAQGKHFSFALGVAVGVVIFVLGWLVGSRCNNANHARKPGLNRSAATATSLASRKAEARAVGRKRARFLGERKAAPAVLNGLELVHDKPTDSYWLILSLDRLPKFRLHGDSDQPHRLRLYGAKCAKNLSFTNVADSPLESLKWANLKNDAELIVSLKRGNYLAEVQTSAVEGSGAVSLKIQIARLSKNAAKINPNLHSWRSDDLMVGDNGLSVASTSVSNQFLHGGAHGKNRDVAEGSFEVKRAQVPMNSEDRSDMAMEQVDRCLERNDLTGAIQKLYVMFGEFGARQDITAMLSALLLETGQIKEAESVLDQGLRKTPHDAALNDLKAKALIHRGDWDKARDHLSKMVVLNDLRQAEMGSLALLGMVDYKLGKFDESIVIYHELTRREPNKAAWWLGLGMSLESFGQTKAAQEAYKYALSMDGVPLEVREALLGRMRWVEGKKR